MIALHRVAPSYIPALRSRFDEDGRAVLPASAPVQPGDRLLAVLGSGHALGFLARGPIYQAALEHNEIEFFG